MIHANTVNTTREGERERKREGEREREGGREITKEFLSQYVYMSVKWPFDFA